MSFARKVARHARHHRSREELIAFLRARAGVLAGQINRLHLQDTPECDEAMHTYQEIRREYLAIAAGLESGEVPRRTFLMLAARFEGVL